ncbi:hypothetical protein GEMRC1_005496 [Eukaryota sp. GEM-RC1]
MGSYMTPQEYREYKQEARAHNAQVADRLRQVSNYSSNSYGAAQLQRNADVIQNTRHMVSCSTDVAHVPGFGTHTMKVVDQVNSRSHK